MIQRAFQHRSGRVISLGRAALAGFFLLAIWLDSSQPTLAQSETYIILAAYVIMASALGAVTWNNWWLETRLAAPAHVLDLAVFTWLVFSTDGYTSPFFTFFVFLILSAAIRWGWRETALTAAVVIALYLSAGVTAIAWATEEFDFGKFVIRSANLVVVSLIMIWFGVNQQASRARLHGGDLLSILATREPPLELAIRFAMSKFGAQRAVVVWQDREEPRLGVATFRQAAFRQEYVDFEQVRAPVNHTLGSQPFIVDVEHQRVLLSNQPRRRKLQHLEQPVDWEFAVKFDVGSALVIPIDADVQNGHIFLMDIPGLCMDDLIAADVFSEEISGLLEKAALLQVNEEAAEARARLSLARDLHDGVVQFLASVSFRLEAISRAVAARRDVSSDLADLKLAVLQEQRDIRLIVEAVRNGNGTSQDLRHSLGKLSERLAQQWKIGCRFESEVSESMVPARIHRETHQLVREAVANAVKHGEATLVRIDLELSGEALRLEISDNGHGFAVPAVAGLEQDPMVPAPKSLSERVHYLGGKVVARSEAAGSCISITIPNQRRAV